MIAEAAAAALFAGGVLASLEALRRRQRNYRRPGRRIRLPVDDEPRRLERSLRAADSYYASDVPAPPSVSLRTALQELARGLHQSGRTMPDCVGVHLVPDPPSMEILLANPAGQPPAPFTMAPDRQEMCWQLDLTNVRPDAWQGPPGMAGDLLPGLFTVGTTTSGYLLLDLELLQVAVVRGEPAITDQFITTAAMEFTTNQWSGWYDLVVAGPFTELEHLDRAEHCDTLDDAIRVLRLRRQALDGRLGASGRLAGGPRPRDLRLTRPDDEDWSLTLLVARMPPSPAQLEELVALAGGHGGIAVLVPSWPDQSVNAPVTIDLQAGSGDLSDATATIRLGFLGEGHELVVRPAALTAAEYEALGSLFATAATLDDVAADEPPYSEFVTPPWMAAAVAEVADEPVRRPSMPHSMPRAVADGRDFVVPPWMATTGAEVADEPVGRPSMPRAVPDGREFVAPPWMAGTSAAVGGETAAPALDSAAPALGDGDHAGFGASNTSAPPNGAGSSGPVPRSAAGTFDEGVPASEGEIDPNSTSVRDAVDGTSGAAAGAAPVPLRVSILGPVEITGTERAIAGQQAELIIALALTAPEGLSGPALAALLGTDPSQPKPVGAVRQLITRTMRALGLSDNGGYYIRDDDGQYALSAEAQLDWTDFVRLFQASLEVGDRGKLEAAVALVRGRPLDGSRYWWLDASVIEIINAQVVDACLRLAESQLAEGDPAAAAATARTGLLADPAAEQLTRVLMRAESAAANPAGVTAAWAACHEAIQSVDPLGSPQDETTELYRALSGDDSSRPRPIRIAG